MTGACTPCRIRVRQAHKTLGCRHACRSTAWRTGLTGLVSVGCVDWYSLVTPGLSEHCVTLPPCAAAPGHLWRRVYMKAGCAGPADPSRHEAAKPSPGCVLARATPPTAHGLATPVTLRPACGGRTPDACEPDGPWARRVPDTMPHVIPKAQRSKVKRFLLKCQFCVCI